MTKQSAYEASGQGQGLFGELPGPTEADHAREQSRAAKRGQGAARVLEPNRSQVELRASDLESLLGEDHRARLVWGYVERQDLSGLFDAIKARGAAPGRRAIDPRILFALWLYATLDGVGSGREVTRLTREHDAYRWICGGVPVNYHALNDFRCANDALMDELLTDNVAALAAVGAITLERVAQDGMRVRADAGAASFRRQARLQEHQAEASELVQTLKRQVQADPGEGSRRAQAAKLRAASVREQRIADALQRLPELAAVKRRNGDKPERPGNGWWTAASPRTLRSMRWRTRPSCMRRCPSPNCPSAKTVTKAATMGRRHRAASSSPSRGTARRWRSGVSA